MLICNSVLVVYQSNESADVVQSVAVKTEYTGCEQKIAQMPSAYFQSTLRVNCERKSLCLVYFKPNSARLAYRLTSVQAVSCFKQTNDTLAWYSRFYAQYS